MVTETSQKTDGRAAPKQCPECGKVVKGGGGLYAHLLLAHNIRRPNITTRLRQENQQLAADLAWRDQTIVNLKQEYETEIQRLNKFCALDEFMAGEAERTESRWAQAACPYCGKSVGSHTEVNDRDTKRKGFMCPTK